MTTPANDDAEPIGNDSSYRRRPLPPWAIVVHTIWANPKVRRAGPTATLVFVYALTQNAEHGRCGTFPATRLEPWYVGDVLGIGEAEATAAIERAVDARLIARDGDDIVVVGWDETFARRALTAAESEARMRRRSRAPRSETQQTQTKKIQTKKIQKNKKERNPDNVRTTSGPSPDSGGSASRSTEPAPPRPLPAPQIAQAAPDVIGNQRRVAQFVGLVNAARQRVAGHHGFEDDHPISGAIVGADGLTLLRLLRKSADPDRDMAKVISVTEADARNDVDKLRFLGWSIVRGHSWETKLGAAPPGSSNRSVFDLVDALVDAGDA